MNEKIKLIQDTVNSKPCGYCGKTHKVELKFTGTADSPVVSYSFSDDTCKEFKVAVHCSPHAGQINKKRNDE